MPSAMIVPVIMKTVGWDLASATRILSPRQPLIVTADSSDVSTPVTLCTWGLQMLTSVWTDTEWRFPNCTVALAPELFISGRTYRLKLLVGTVNSADGVLYLISKVGSVFGQGDMSPDICHLTWHLPQVCPFAQFSLQV
jgi:hypothetical protein